MKTPLRLALRALGAATLLGLGFVAGRRSAVSPTAASAGSHLLVPSMTAVARPIERPAEAPVGAGAARAFRQRLAFERRCPTADRAAADWLADLAKRDPETALALAGEESNRSRRTLWLKAALRGWAAHAPAAAAAWVRSHPEVDRENAEAAVMDGAMDAGTATDVAREWVEQDPANTRSHVNQLLRVLDDRGDFETGVAFATALPDDRRAEAVATAFQYWAQSQPERALDAALQTPSGPARADALDGVAGAWAMEDPKGLAEFAIKLPVLEDRMRLLEPALREWVQQDPRAASEWMQPLDTAPELDAGAEAIALQPAVLALRPAVAVEWAESITRPDLRSSTLATVVRDWSIHDPVAALAYATTSTALLGADRTVLLAELAGH